jgi:hemerythrin-like domain-containing protein
MLRSIGKGPTNEDRSLVGRLVDCHARIREMTALAVGLARDPRPSNDEIVEIASRVGRYFSRALPNHVRDEEESILPRLAHATPEVARALELMRSEHREHEAHLERLLQACEALAADPASWSDLRGDVAEDAARLSTAFALHLEAEERDIFPRIAELDTAAQDAILREMEARRNDGQGGAGRRGGGGGRGPSRNDGPRGA